MKTKSIQATYIFIILAFLLLLGAIFIYNEIDNTRNNINDINYKSNIQHVENISNNIKNKILNSTSSNIYKSLKLDENTRIKLEKDLQYFISDRYKDIYLLDKISSKKKDFRVLIDATKNLNDKFDFEEMYRPDNIEKYNKAYTSKKSISFENKDIKSLWMTNIYPIIIDGKVNSILIVDFSIKELNTITSTLTKLDDMFKTALLFIIFVFIVIVYFSYSDFKREKLKQKTYEKLEVKTDELEKESNKVKELNENLEFKILQLNKAIVAKSDFLANMSHEIRTPLNGILGFIDILKENVTNEENKKYLTVIDNSSNHLLGVINDILDFSKIENGKLDIEYINFNTKYELQSTIDLFEAKASENNISLKINLNKNLPENLVGDPLRIKQVLLNLLSNAIKFTPNYKKVYLDIAYTNGLLSVSVKDEGIGIAEDKIFHIFEAFSQADNSTTRKYGGTGLGLSISNKIILLMDGELKLKSKLDVGSEFYFSIPLDIGKEVVIKENNINNINFHGAKLLLVEDNKANQMFMKVVLKKLKLEFDIANDGLEAVKEFKNNKYDVILMDENMPNLNGIEATKQILAIEKEQNLKHTPIIALTANALKGDRERFLDAGMDEYLTKPVDKKKLNEVLSRFFKS